MKYCIDIDGTICTQTADPKNRAYNNAKPLLKRIEIFNKLFDDGNYIIYYTARGSSSGLDWGTFTKHQLSIWGVKYHKLVFGKPDADIFIDDKAVNIKDFVK